MAKSRLWFASNALATLYFQALQAFMHSPRARARRDIEMARRHKSKWLYKNS
jgi:hypothetical protein